MRYFRAGGGEEIAADNILNSEKGGVALILVVWVMVILVAVVGEFSYSMRTEVNLIRNFKEEEESYQRAVAGVESAKIEILTADEPAKMFVNEDGLLVFDRDAELPERKGSLAGGYFEYVLTDEESKLNINRANPEQIRYVLIESGVESTDADVIVDSILDWRDSNDLHHFNGAEEDYYRSLPEPYSSKDGSFDTIEELLLVKGMNREILYGFSSDEGEEEYKGVVNYFTVKGGGRININTASSTVLEAVCGIDIANAIIRQRAEGPVTSAKCGKTFSSFFTVVSTGGNNGGAIKRSVKTVLRKKQNKLETVFWLDNAIG